jgi:murein DD-endopeptidase MepM/ murein hydrolase activator NlpD
VKAVRSVAEEFVRLLNVADYGAVQRMFDAQMDQAFPAPESTAFFSELKQHHGRLEKLGEMRIEGEWSAFPAHFEHGSLDFKIALDPSGKIAGLLFLPASSGTKAPARNQTTLWLPFNGTWLVSWGGDTREVNAHHDTPNQKFAFDLIGVGDNGRTRRNHSNTNEDYFAFCREVLAPADGVVVEAIDGVRDNEPGFMNPYSMVGNCVIIQHCENEFSVFAHFQRGTVRVSAGEKVQRGDVLGLCGNSGNSSEPHLHYHLQHESRLAEGLAIKLFFDRVVVHRDGKRETRSDYSPLKGDVISRE